MKDGRNDDGRRGDGVTRRGFLGTVGAGAAVAATGLTAGHAAPQLAAGEDHEGMVPVVLKVNGHRHALMVEPRWTLLYVLRERLGLTGTKVGCERGECGACTVLFGDTPRYSCSTLAVEADGDEITTLEGLLEGEELGETQQAFLEEDAFQCGYCTPGQIMATEGLLRSNPDPTVEEVRTGVSGNLCRCGAYVHIFRAGRRAAELKRQKGARDA